jgi:hypothetical protein
MLTKQDLKNIGTLIDTKLETKLESKFDEKLKPIKKTLKEMNNKLDTAIRFFDTSTIGHEKRIKRIEKHLDLPPLAD